MLIPYRLPLEWVSRRNSTPSVVLLRHNGVKELIDQMQPGDQLRAFNSPRKAWKRRAGRRGYVVLRNGQPIAASITALN